MLTQEQADRFWSKVIKGGNDECWPWAGQRLPNGYGKFGCRGGGKRAFYGAHRLALTLTYREPEEGEFCLHSCDNPCCCNPSHLRWGSPTENIRDSITKGRFKIGARHWKARLSPEDVRAIRASNDEPMMIAQRFGIARATVYNIRKRHIWKHVA